MRFGIAADHGGFELKVHRLKSPGACPSALGACVAANKVPGLRAELIPDFFSAHQGVEDDDRNVTCPDGRTVQALS